MRELGLIGRKLSHSFSAKYFAEKFERESLTAEYSYSLFELEDISDVKSLIESHPDLVGFNVTIPYKQQIIPYLDELDSEAERVGAVNCVKRFADGRLVGYNTDIDGIRLSLDKLLNNQTELPKALVLGTGGASQAVQYVLLQREMEYALVSRDAARANYTYAQLTLELIQDYKLIINTSPVGMYPLTDEAPALPYEALTPHHYLFDLVYNPPVTLFLKRGAERGAHTLAGLDMLYAQAEAAWRIWSEPTL